MDCQSFSVDLERSSKHAGETKSKNGLSEMSHLMLKFVSFRRQIGESNQVYG